MIATLTGFFSVIAANSWQAALFIPFVLLVRALVGERIAARWRHLIWIVVMVRLLMPPVWLPASALSLQNVTMLERPIEQAQGAVDASAYQTLFPGEQPIPAVRESKSGSTTIQETPSSAVAWSWLSLAAMTWIMGTSIGAALILGAQASLSRRIAAEALPVPGRIAAAFANSCRRLKIARKPGLLISEAVESPLLIGLLRPRLVLPRAANCEYADEDLDHIFAHELAHLRRADAWSQMLQLAVLCLHWFNPLVWLACRAAQFDGERAADEWALARLNGAPDAYGRTLLKLVVAQSGSPVRLATLGIVEDRNQLKSRLRSIVGFATRRWTDSAAGMALLALLALMLLSSRGIAESIRAVRDSICDRNGVILVERRSSATPHYPYRAMAAQTLGFVRGDLQMRHGIQGLLEDKLHASVQLTLDARVQFIAEKAMRDAGRSRGAAVVMDPNNGDVLALVSLPGYDPNKVVRLSGHDLQALEENATGPLSNRALAADTPGSTFKLVVALAGLASGKATPQTEFDCPGAIPIGDHLFYSADRTAAGRLNLGHALTVSNDVYFYQYGMLTGIHAIDDMAVRTGFGRRWGVLGGLDESSGLVPGPDWMKSEQSWLQRTHRVTQWKDEQTVNTAIGQGFVLATPLQMSAFVGAIANGGTVYRPRLYSRVEDDAGNVIAGQAEGRIFNTLGVKPSDLQAVQKAMLDAMQSDRGTARQARVPGMEVAGKTGNAQVLRKEGTLLNREVETWFTCYAPFHKPRYVVTIVVDDGNWDGTTCAPIAKQILTQLFRMDEGERITPQPLAPVTATFPPAPLAK